MLIYVVRNEHHQEVAAYSCRKEAEMVAEELQSLSLRPFSVEPFGSVTEDRLPEEDLSGAP